MSQPLFSENILTRRCRVRNLNARMPGPVYEVVAVYFGSSWRLTCALLTDDGQPNESLFTDLDFLPDDEG